MRMHLLSHPSYLPILLTWYHTFPSYLPHSSILSDIERHLAPFKQAIEQKDMLDKTIMQCVFIGTQAKAA